MNRFHLAMLVSVALATQTLPAQGLTPIEVPFLTDAHEHLDAGVAYDVARDRVVLHDGRTGKTWEADGSRWEVRNSSRSPGGEHGPMAYDLARRRTLMFTGSTWEWDGFDWTRRTPAQSPPNGLGTAMAYDIVRDRMVVVTGSPLQTWEWDGQNWTQRQPQTTPPSGFGPWPDYAVTYDLARRVVVLYVLFGGSGARTWEWNGTDWSQARTTSEPVGLNLLAKAAYDVGRGRVVMSLFDGLWEYDGKGWTRVTGARQAHVVYDTHRGETLVLPVGDEIWAWNGSRITGLVGPAPAEFDEPGATLVADPVRGKVVAFGGHRDDMMGGSYHTKLTREWDGRAWRTLAPVASPPERSYAGMVFDSMQQRVLMFGGSQWYVPPRGPSGWIPLGDTWSFDGKTWTQLAPTNRPPAGESTAMVWDVHRGRAVLFIGGETWEWTGFDWTRRLTNAAPSVRWGHAMAYDPSRKQTVLFGGTSGGSETWTYDGTNWTQHNPQTVPPQRYGHAMAWLPSRGRVLLYGGYSSGTAASDAWEWTGSDWQLAPASPLPPAFGPSMVLDPTRGGLLVHVPVSVFTAAKTFLLGDLAPAVATRSGQGCAGTGSAPTIGASDPRLGNDVFQIELQGTRPNAPALFAVSASTGSTPLGPCTVYVGAQALLVPLVTNGAGFGRIAAAIPLDPLLRGVVIQLQGVATDPAGPFGLALTGALTLRVGD